MFKLIFVILFFLTALFYPSDIYAHSSSFVSVVNPVRGDDFKDLKDQKAEEALLGQMEILKRFNIPATWLIRYDAFSNKTIVNNLNKNAKDEKGLFLEITPTWTKDSGVDYRQSSSWHNAGSAFLSGYETDERKKLIDTSFEKFKSVFGDYPKSVGAWWVDAYSASYMQEKYGITSILIVADQYTTDNYQIWGQYWSTPYYPSKNHMLRPAQSLENKIPLVVTQWAARDPVYGYGSRVEDSTFSVQANDYLDYHNLDIKYFSNLVDIYTNQPLSQLSHLVVGLENSYSWDKYKVEYENQMKFLYEKQKTNQFLIVTMKDFSIWYKNKFPTLSPSQIIVANDPLGGFKKSVWFMNPYFRAGWFINSEGSVFRDIRQYIEGEEELCFKKSCDSLNFATSATRVLDDVSFGHRFLIDEGKISDFNVTKLNGKYILSYKNEAGKLRTIEFLPRDISIDGKVSSIDSLILEATKYQLKAGKDQTTIERGFFNWSPASILLATIKFLVFLILGCLVPGFVFIKKLLPEETPKLQIITLSLVLGFTQITLLFYFLSLFNLKIAIFPYLVINLFILLKERRFILDNFLTVKDKFSYLAIGLIGLGTLFQQLPVFKNGLNFPYGLGFWGPNSHDGFWHISLVNQLIKGIPPQNPILSGEVLKNYHYFYDLLVAATSYISGIGVSDLLFRFYPVTFSLILGIGTYYLIKYKFHLKNNWESRLTILSSLYLVYFAGSFGWIVEYIKLRHLGGESAFWANQSISFNLNPPFAVSLIIVIAIFQLLPVIKQKKHIIVLTLLAGILISFKAYAGVLILLSFLLMGIIKKSPIFLVIFAISSILSAFLFFSNFSTGKQLIIFSPFWFIHSMVDSPDRVGWVRLSLARVAGLESGNWFKFFASETVSILLFIFGNLGTRVFALFSLVRIKRIISSPSYLFVFLFSILALLIPILFIQAGNPWNTIQFMYYFLYVSSVVGGLIFAKIVVNLPKILGFPLLAIFILTTPINSWATANGYLSYQPHAFVSKEESEALEFLRAQNEGVVLTYPFDPKLKNNIAEPWPIFVYDSTSYVSALTKKSVFVEDEPQNQILLTDYKKRVVAARDFFISNEEEFLRQNNIKYIYLPKKLNVRLDPVNIKNIFENDQVIIYQYE